MENKALELVVEVNSDQDENILDYVSNGYCEGIQLTDVFLWDDQNSSVEFVRQITLSTLVKDLNRVLKVVEPMLADEIDKFFVEKEKQVLEKFKNAKMEYWKQGTCTYGVLILGGYNEDMMKCFIDVLEEDFKYIFQGMEIKCDY